MTDAMHSIPFTQYILPDGRRADVSIERPTAIAEKARKIINSGFVFECEVLTTGHVSLTITDPEEGDLAFEICENGEAVPEAVDRLVERFVVEKVT